MVHIATSTDVEKSTNIAVKMSSPNKLNKKRLQSIQNFDIIILRREKKHG